MLRAISAKDRRRIVQHGRRGWRWKLREQRHGDQLRQRLSRHLARSHAVFLLRAGRRRRFGRFQRRGRFFTKFLGHVSGHRRRGRPGQRRQYSDAGEQRQISRHSNEGSHAIFAESVGGGGGAGGFGSSLSANYEGRSATLAVAVEAVTGWHGRHRQQCLCGRTPAR